MHRRLAVASERGLTIVELMVATIVLAVGILGTVSMIDTSNANTSKTKAREGATNLGRAVLEIARAVPYRELTAANVLAELGRHPGLEDASTAPGYQIRSRNFTYEISVDVCSLDDEKDRLGSHDEDAIVFCPDTDVLVGGAPAQDRNPDDYRRVSLSLSWKAPDAVTARTRQTGVITNPVGGLGPSVTSLDITAPVLGNTTISTAATTATFAARTSVSAKEVQWSIDGDPKGKAIGSGVNWSFDWDLAEARGDGSLRYPDCTYVIRAEGYDDKDRSGAPKALTVKLNRIAPVAPTGLEGGRNLNGSRVDLQWHPNRECDIEGYRVYRGTSSGSVDTLVCTTAANDTDCIDDSAPAPAAGQSLYYQVVALDTSPSFSQREGERSAQITISEGNGPPASPSNLVACLGGNPGCTDIDGNEAPGGTIALSWEPSTDPDPGDGILFYRLYRGGDTYGDRYDILFPVAGKPLVFVDESPPSGSNSYWVSAVDAHFGESELHGPVTISR